MEYLAGRLLCMSIQGPHSDSTTKVGQGSTTSYSRLLHTTVHTNVASHLVY